MRELQRALEAARIIDLAQPYYPGMPHHPHHPPFVYGLSKAHGESSWRGVSAAGDAISLGGHVGTHIDALCHFSLRGKLFGGADAVGCQSYTLGISAHHVDTIQPIFRRCVLLDVAATQGEEVLPPDFVIDADCLERAAERAGVRPGPGDIALVRTGWGRFWHDPGRYINSLRCPGVNLDAACWLSSLGVFAGGSDTIAFEFLPAKGMPVHVHFLVESGIHIIEALDLEGLAKAGIHEFVFAAAPLRLPGATGSPIRPVALCTR
ncbi:MAG: cyclase family protein [Bryobacterales bacterium]|nr:cyclase family protein [Bryobacterales bacterium]